MADDHQDMMIRSFQPGDLQGAVSLLGVTMPMEGISEARFVRQVLLDPNFVEAGMPVAVMEGRVVGFVVSIARQVPLENAPGDSERGYITLMGVEPGYRGRGIGSALLEAAEGYLKSQKRSVVMISSYAPGYFICGVDVGVYEEGLRFLKKRGYGEVYRPIAMEAPLWSLEVPEWVLKKREEAEAKGVRFEAYRSELTLPMLEFVKREFPGDWVRVVRSCMDRMMHGESAGRLQVCHDGEGQVLGFSHYEGERFGPIGTAVSRRGEGLGQVLMYRTLAAQKEAGMRVAWFMWSDDKTAVRIYSAAGFREVRRFALLKKEI